MKPVRTLLIAAVCWLWMAAGQVCAQLRCEDSAVRLGQVKAGQPLFHRFTIINHGKDEARVTEVRPSCGCLRPRLDEHILRPGQQATLILEANTLTQPAGPNAWKVRIFYTCGNDEKRELALILFAEIVTEIQVLPPALVLH
ncbi:MAG: DUF1573 domain-containing protein, partial [Candidatus Acidiferrum sp.]